MLKGIIVVNVLFEEVFLPYRKSRTLYTYMILENLHFSMISIKKICIYGIELKL